MSLDRGDLEISVVRSEVERLREALGQILGDDLLRLHADDVSSARSDRQNEIIRSNLVDMHRVLQMRRALPYLYSRIAVDAFALEVYVEHVEVLHVVEYDKVSLIARSDGSHVLEAVAFRGVDRCHLDGLERIEPELYSSPDIVDDVAFPQYVLDVLVVRAEAEVLCVYSRSDDAAYDIVYVVGRGALSYVNVYAPSRLLESILE